MSDKRTELYRQVAFATDVMFNIPDNGRVCQMQNNAVALNLNDCNSISCARFFVLFTDRILVNGRRLGIIGSVSIQI